VIYGAASRMRGRGTVLRGVEGVKCSQTPTCEPHSAPLSVADRRSLADRLTIETLRGSLHR